MDGGTNRDREYGDHVSPAQVRGSIDAANVYGTERRVRAIACGGLDEAFRPFDRREDGYIKIIFDPTASRP
jgi:hypothetical protein